MSRVTSEGPSYGSSDLFFRQAEKKTAARALSWISRWMCRIPCHRRHRALPVQRMPETSVPDAGLPERCFHEALVVRNEGPPIGSLRPARLFRDGSARPRRVSQSLYIPFFPLPSHGRDAPAVFRIGPSPTSLEIREFVIVTQHRMEVIASGAPGPSTGLSIQAGDDTCLCWRLR